MILDFVFSLHLLTNGCLCGYSWIYAVSPNVLKVNGYGNCFTLHVRIEEADACPFATSPVTVTITTTEMVRGSKKVGIGLNHHTGLLKYF